MEVLIKTTTKAGFSVDGDVVIVVVFFIMSFIVVIGGCSGYLDRVDVLARTVFDKGHAVC